MKRLHIHIKTKDLDQSINFYSAMFGEEPTHREDDYAKWLLDDPRAHISLSTHGGDLGVDHAGIAIETREELDEIAGRLRSTGSSLVAEEATTCCYAQSNKFWARDPQGAVWELFQTYGDSEEYGVEPDREMAPVSAVKACCGPAAG